MYFSKLKIPCRTCLNYNVDASNVMNTYYMVHSYRDIDIISMPCYEDPLKQRTAPLRKLGGVNTSVEQAMVIADR